MVIRHSLQLLEQLSELEERIQYLETIARSQGLEVDSELILRVAYSDYFRRKSCGTPPLTSNVPLS